MDIVQIVTQGGALALLALVLFVGGPRALSAFQTVSAEFVKSLAQSHQTTRRALRLVRTLTKEVRQLADQVRQLGKEFHDIKSAIADHTEVKT